MIIIIIIIYVGSLTSRVTVTAFMRSSSNMTTSSYLKKNINMDSNVFEIIVNSTEIITKNPIVNIAKNR